MSDVLGKPPSGFTAPAWMYSKGTREVLKQFPFEWIENRWSIEFPDRDNYTVPAVVFASRTPWKRLCSRFWSAAGPAVFSGGRVFRLALHVKDLPALQKSVERALSNSTRHRTCVRCADLVLN
jgi:predicted deacetylase